MRTLSTLAVFALLCQALPGHAQGAPPPDGGAPSNPTSAPDVPAIPALPALPPTPSAPTGAPAASEEPSGVPSIPALPSTPGAPTAAPAAAPSGGTQYFAGLMNPSISFNGLMVGGAEWNDGKLAEPHLGGDAADHAFPRAGQTFGTGINVQEMEMQILSNVDPYFKANAVLSIPGTEGIEVEEGYVTLVSVPHLLVNVGKIKEPFGRENTVHTHALLMLDPSLIGQRIFGDEGLNDVTANAALLLPTPWFSELTLGVDRGSNQVVLNSGQPGGFGFLAHWTNLFDVTDNYSASLGVSGLTGENQFHNQSYVGGVDLTVRGHGSGFRQWNRVIWQSEYMVMNRAGAPTDERLGGLYSTLEYSLDQLWWVGGRFDYVGLPAPTEGGRTTAGSAILVLAPTEFSAIRLQYQHQWVPDGHRIDELQAQINFVIGVHPAHAY